MQNRYAERVIGIMKWECTDFLLPVNEHHIHRHLIQLHLQHTSITSRD